MPPVIDYEKCTCCGTCADLCAEDVFFRTADAVQPAGQEEPIVTHPELCYHCYLCVEECPSDAIWLRTPMTMTVPFKSDAVYSD